MRIRRALLLAFLLLAIASTLAACGVRPFSSSTQSAAPESLSSEATKGAWLYVEYACVQCHGLGGRGRDLGPVSGPSLISTSFKTAFPRGPEHDEAIGDFIKTGAIVENGRAASMPAWNGILSDEELTSLVAYIRAGLPDIGVQRPRPKTGEEIYKAYACVKCHGEMGVGGMRNVAASTPEYKMIPVVGGPDFRKRFDSREKVRALLLNGRLVEGGKPGVVYMPAWGRIGTADEIEKIIDYLWGPG